MKIQSPLRASFFVAMTLSLTAMVAPAFADDKAIGETIKALASGSKEDRKAAHKALAEWGYEAARALQAAVDGDEAYQKHRSALIAPFKARLYWDESKRRGATKNLIGRLKGNAYFFGKKMGAAEMTVYSRPDGSLRIVSSGQGKLQNFSGSIEADSTYDGFLQLVSITFKAQFKDSKGGQSGTYHQLWTRVKGKSTKTHHVFNIDDKENKKQRQARIPRGAVMADLFVVLGRGLDYASKQRQTVALNIINPEDLSTIPVSVKSVRREKTVAKGGARLKALRLEASAPNIPKQFGSPKAWIGPDNKPIKGRLGAFTIYGKTTFEKVKEERPARSNPKKTEPKPKATPKKRKFF